MEKNIINRRVDEEEIKVVEKVLFNAILFKLEKNLFAVNIENLQEIIFFRTIYKVPGTNETLLGVINLRGNIIPVFSLKLILGSEDNLVGKNKIYEDEKLIMILRNKKDILGLVVDSIYKNIAVKEENYRSQELINNWVKNYLFDGVILYEGREIFTLSVEGLLNYIFSIK